LFVNIQREGLEGLEGGDGCLRTGVKRKFCDVGRLVDWFVSDGVLEVMEELVSYMIRNRKTKALSSGNHVLHISSIKP